MSLLGAVAVHGVLLLAMAPEPAPEPPAAPPVLTWLEVAAAGPALAHEARGGGRVAATEAVHAAAPQARPAAARRPQRARPKASAVAASVRSDRVEGMIALPVLAQAVLNDLEQQSSLGQRGETAVDGQGLSQAGGEPASGSPGGYGAGGAGPGGAPGLHASRQGPRLLAGSRGCRSYFPATAQTEHGQVRVRVRVDAHGHAKVDRVLVESPLGQGFGGAASACVQFLRFEPAVDPMGRAVAGLATLHLDFDRT